jgi:hypothetical protein
MNQKSVLILCLALCGALILVAGCTTPGTQPNVTPAATATPPAVTALDDLLLISADLPPGYSIVYMGEMGPGDPNCTASEVCFIEGYLVSARSGETNTSTAIDQAVVHYSKPATPATLETVLVDQLPGVASGNVTPLTNPAIGDASAAYLVSLPTATGPVDGYIVIFGKGDFYEIILVAGPDASESLATDMAKAAAAKLP